MKISLFGKNNNKKTFEKRQLMSIDISPIMSLVFSNKKYSLYRFNYLNNPIYFITGNEILLYSFVISAYDKKNELLFKTNDKDYVSVILLFSIDETNYTSTDIAFGIENYKQLGTIFDKKEIKSSIVDDSIARLILAVSVEGFDKVKKVSLSNYKEAVGTINKKMEDEVPSEISNDEIINKPSQNNKKINNEIMNSKIANIKPVIKQDVEEENNDEEENNNKNIEKDKLEIKEEIYNTKKEDENKVSTTTSNIEKIPMSDISEKIYKIKQANPIKIDENYFVGYLINVESDLSSSNGYKWEYSMNKNRQPVKVYLSPKDFNKILTTHIFISGKTGSGKTSFNNGLLHPLLYHGVSLFTYDIKSGSIDYSSTIINKPETKENMLKEMNDSKYKGVLPSEKNILFTKDDIPDEALKIINPDVGTFKNRFGKKVIPLVIYNNPDEVENIKSFTALNILDNQLRTELIKLIKAIKLGQNVETEYNATKQQYKEGINKMLNVYFKVLSKSISVSKRNYVSILADSITNKIIDFMQKSGFVLFPSNYDFSNWIKDYKMFGKELSSDSEEKRFLDNMYDNSIAKKIIDFESGINLYSIIKTIILDMKTNFYLTIRTNTDLVGFYIIYMYYMLLKGEKLKLEGLEDSGCYTAVFIDESHYLNSADPILQRVLIDAQRTDRLRNRGWIFSSQRIFQKSFGTQESLGNFILFAQQSADIASQKTRFSKVFNKEVLQFIGTQNFAFTYDNNSFFIDENGNYISRESTAIKSFPNRAYSKDIMEYGVDKYAEKITPYLAQNFKMPNEIEIEPPPFKIETDLLNDEGKLVIGQIKESEDAKLRVYLSDVIELKFASLLSTPKEELNSKYFSTQTLQFINKILLLIEVNRKYSSESRMIIDEYINNYKPEKNYDMINKILSLSMNYRNSIE